MQQGPPRTDRHEHPQSAQTLYVGTRPLPLAGLPHLPASSSAPAHLAAVVPSVRSAPDPRQRQIHRSELPHKVPARVEEDQNGVAGPELRNGQGRLDSLAFDPGHCAIGSPSTSKLGSQVPPSHRKARSTARSRSEGIAHCLNALLGPPTATRTAKLSTDRCDPGQFSTSIRDHSHERPYVHSGSPYK